MSFDRRTLSLTLALLFALRTVVPVGYMLQVPAAGDSPGFGLVLCPIQNAGLDVSLFAPLAAETQHGRHPGHAHGGPGNAGDGTVAMGSDCGAWLSSASLAFESTPLPVLRPSATRDGLISYTQRFVANRPGNDALARAPPRIT